MCIPSFALIGYCVSELQAYLCPYCNIWPDCCLLLFFSLASGSFSVTGDYFSRSAAFGFIPDETCVNIPINEDDLQEPTENFFVTFVPDVPGARSVIATVNIRDNEPIIGTCINNE